MAITTSPYEATTIRTLRLQTIVRLRWLAVAVLVVSLVPAVQSMNRGLWVVLVLMAVLMFGRLIVRGNLNAAVIMMASLAVAATLIFATPLGDFVSGRLQNESSNSIRWLSSMPSASRLMTTRSIGRPTPRFERIVESIEISPTLSAS